MSIDDLQKVDIRDLTQKESNLHYRLTLFSHTIFYLDINERVCVLFATHTSFTEAPTVGNVVAKVIQIQFAWSVTMDNGREGLIARIENARFPRVEIQFHVICWMKTKRFMRIGKETYREYHFSLYSIICKNELTFLTL